MPTLGLGESSMCSIASDLGDITDLGTEADEGGREDAGDDGSTAATAAAVNSSGPEPSEPVTIALRSCDNVPSRLALQATQHGMCAGFALPVDWCRCCKYCRLNPINARGQWARRKRLGEGTQAICGTRESRDG